MNKNISSRIGASFSSQTRKRRFFVKRRHYASFCIRILRDQIDQPEQICDGVDGREKFNNKRLCNFQSEEIGIEMIQNGNQKLHENIGNHPCPNKAVEQPNNCAEQSVCLFYNGNLFNQGVKYL